MARKQKEKVLVLDSDSAVYAVGFMCQKKIHFAEYKGDIVYTCTDKRKGNKWLKKQELYPADEVEWDFKEELSPVSTALANIKSWVEKQLEFSGCSRVIPLLTKGGSDFRNNMATIQRYKGNRLQSVKPKHYDALRTYLQKFYGALMYAKWEADDTAVMIMEKGKGNPDKSYILAAIDKDLKQMDCMHSDPNHPEQGVYAVSVFEGWHAFYVQMLMGDGADNIKGLSGTKGHPGVGKVTALKMLEDCETVEQLCTVVWEAYQAKYPEPFKLLFWWWSDEWEDDDAGVLAKRKTHRTKTKTVDAQYMFRENADLLYMLRHEHDQFIPHIKFPKWKPYKNGVVPHVLGD
ncbi:MAG: hypothetical protein V3S69_02570 [Dehalococcoidales bacterium]